MEKKFFEAFPLIKLNEELKGLFAEAEVTRVSVSKNRDELRVRMVSRRLIQRESVFALERELKRQLFPGEGMRVRVTESFSLSGQYTLKSLFDAYRDSVLSEFGEISVLDYNLLRGAETEFPDENSLIVKLTDSVPARQRRGEIAEILERIFNERCGMRGEISVVTCGYGGERATREEIDEDLRREAKRERESVSEAEQGKAEKKAPAAEEEASKAKSSRKRTKSPDTIYGRDFEPDLIPIESVEEEMGEVAVRGQVADTEEREIRGERTVFRFVLTDRTDSIAAKLFLKNEELPGIRQEICKGAFLALCGTAATDAFDRELMFGRVYGIRKISPFFAERTDNAPAKRVELHCHTKMSELDAVSDAKEVIERAVKWGHKAIAITDHGNVQAFTDAAKIVSPKDDFKVIYGMEAYIVDDTVSPVKHIRDGEAEGGEPEEPGSLDGSFVVFDIETTGFSARKNRIIEIGAVRLGNGEITDRFSSFVNPKVPVPDSIVKLTGIDDETLKGAPAIEKVLPDFMEFSKGAVMVAHNADFDMSFIRKGCEELSLPCVKTVADTLVLARILMPEQKRYRLDALAKALHIRLKHHHRAVDDAQSTAEIFLKFAEMLKDRGIESLDRVEELKITSPEAVRRLSCHHAVLLAANDVGRVNLYRMVSSSHLEHFYRRPLIPKSKLSSHREGILVGSACGAGELFPAALYGRPEDELERIAGFYDYLEIQPAANNEFLIKSEKEPAESLEDIRDANRRIVALGERMGIPVAATGDVHFIDPEDEIYRRIIMYGKRMEGADEQPPLYLRTTEEMLEEFSYLSPEKAEEVVVTNPNRISDMCERITAVRPDKCPPEIENSDQTLSDICYKRAHEIYGEELPDIVKARLERELGSIISNGFAVLYIIAQKLVWKSNEDGYLVGSRGSVGSSFAATMAGITEVNPLPPHYVCRNCHFTDFDSEEVRKFAGRAGCDMPDRLCPVCGQKLSKDGFDIPFETFLGFEGNKEPDIDLNFSGDYQGRAHKYTEVIFGEGQTFRAGTIGTLQDKTAFGYVKNYFEDHGINKRGCEIDRIVQGCVGVRRTTGQHTGGIIVLPVGEEICSFTPVQHPANDTDSDIVTTHFDYHSIEHNLLKLDILGHDDPTMIRMLQDLTGINPKDIPLDDPEVMSLFADTKALGITQEDIGGCPLGALGVPEFGTDYAMQILLETHPTQFSDLVRIAGLSHGTNVWGGTAQTLLREGKATISTAICTRDDIMTYLISMGLPSEKAFKIMERVRKGAVAKGKCKEWPEWKEEMAKCGVPDWYIWSCEKIQYMFPKAHAAAYVMMAWRIAYWKLHYPLEYYAAFFSIRATAFDYEIMCRGRAHLESTIKEYQARKDGLSAKEKDTLRDMRIVQEMYARGFEFMPLDIYRAKAQTFQVIDGKLMPSIRAIGGMGDKAAEGVSEAAAQGPFLSRDDFRERTKVSKPVAELMEGLGLLEGMPETNQFSIFDIE